MSYFAKIQPTANSSIYTVTEVISAEQDFINSGYVGPPSLWVQTSYNTYGNVHYAPSPPAPPKTPDGGIPFRANYAGIGYIYDTSVVIDSVVGVFYAPRPSNGYGVFNSWILDASTYLWNPPNPPGPAPDDGQVWYWDDPNVAWTTTPPPGA